ncbi:MAG: 3-hydroxyacyl-CoA dehydrogenase [Pseudomonadota bacterium]
MAEQFVNALPIERDVLVIGAGTMGRGIAQVAAAAGHRVIWRDANAAALDQAISKVRSDLNKRVDKGKATRDEADAICARLVVGTEQTPLDRVGLVIEVIVERLDVKVAVLGQLVDQLPADAILATNTSSLSVTALGGQLPCPERVVGMHFFNPATVLPLVEVVKGQATADGVVATVMATAKAWGKTPVLCRSTPGFIVNRVARPYYGEALRLLLEQATSPATVDAVLRDSGGFKMGPCELMDLIGHDVNYAVTRSVFEAFNGDPRYQPSLVQRDLVDAGWLGRKSGRGFFSYAADSAAPAPDELIAEAAALPRSVVIEGDLGPASGLAVLLHAHEEVTVSTKPGRGLIRIDGLALALCDGRTATQRSRDAGEPVVSLDLALDWRACTRVALSMPLQLDPARVHGVVALFALLGKKVSLLADVPGMAVTRTVAMLTNEAAEAVYHGIATADDVDAAMKLGVNYPVGPMAWGRRVGWHWVLQVLGHLQQAYREDRYRPSVWVQRTVQAIHTDEEALA